MSPALIAHQSAALLRPMTRRNRRRHTAARAAFRRVTVTTLAAGALTLATLAASALDRWTAESRPEHAPRSAAISAHALATRQQLIGIAKAALGLTGRPFRSPVETPEGITQEQKRERLTITPAAPLRPEDIDDSEV